ncbi:hypothetical protein CRYUN_Cryun13aG0082600 [Craigia yunnanensis]
MEALNFLRFWKPSYGAHKENQNQPCYGNSCTTEIQKSLIVSDHELDEGEDSFIDLELPLHEFDDKGNVHGNSHEEIGGKGKKRFDSKEERALHEPAKNVGDKELDLPQQTRSLSPNDHFSKRKIIPIEPSSKPQSPIALLKSSPKFRFFTRKKSKSMANTSNTYIAEKTEFIGISMETPKHDKQGTSKYFKVKFKIEESPNLPIFNRENSLRKTKGKTEDSLTDDSSKRLSKDLTQKCLNIIIKPLYVKVTKKNSQSDKIKVSGDLSMSSPAASPAMACSMKEKHGNLSTGVRGVCKHLGKSRSASAASSPISRRDDSLLLQHDGIQSAILHCKKSLNSSRESSWLSRCTSDSSQEKLSNASSTDSSLLSRVTSNASCEKLIDSARISREE